MNALSVIAPQFFILVFVIALGFVIRKLRWATDEFDAVLTKVILQVSCPCMLLAAVLDATDLPGPQELMLYLAIAVVAYLVLLAIAFGISRFLAPSASQRGTYTFMISFGNIVFFGLPVSTAVFGPSAAVYIAIISVPFNILVFSLGAYLISKDGADVDSFKGRGAASIARGLLTKPINIASLLCLVLALLGVHGGGVLLDALETAGSLTLPAALLVIGSSLAKYPVKQMLGTWRTAVVVVLRLVIVPLATFALLRLFDLDPVFMGALVLAFAMPVATNGTLICIQYGVDLREMTSATFVSNVAEILTIPLVCSFLL